VEIKWREPGILVYYWWEYKMVQQLWKTVWQFLKKLKIELQNGPVYIQKN
jgi:hypothetical protein